MGKSDRPEGLRVDGVAFGRRGKWVDVIDGELPRGVELVDVGMGLRIAEMVRGKVSVEAWPFVVVVTIENSGDRADVRSVEVESAAGSSVTSVQLRAVPVDFAVFLIQIVAMGVCSPGVLAALRPVEELTHDEYLERVAGLYRYAVVIREDAAELVAETLGVSIATAGRLIRVCRERDLLGPARRGAGSRKGGA